MATQNNIHAENAGGEHDKLFVGDLSLTISPGAMSRISEQVGEIMDAQIILRGGQALGYGKVTFNVRGSGATAAEGDIQGTARLERSDRGEPRAPRGKKARKPAGRARRSADDPDYATTEEAAANGQTSVQAVTKGLGDLSTSDKNANNARIDNDTSANGGAVEGAAAETIRNAVGGAAGRGARAAKRGRGGRGAANAKPRVRKERGEPSKTLVYIRNLPYSLNEEKLTEILNSNGLSFQSVSVPVAKFGHNKGKGRGYGFVTVESEEQQGKTIQALDGKELTAAGVLSEASATTTTETTEGEATKEGGERKFKLSARPGYDEPEKNGEEEEGVAGPEDSGTAENDEVQTTEKNGETSNLATAAVVA